MFNLPVFFKKALLALSIFAVGLAALPASPAAAAGAADEGSPPGSEQLAQVWAQEMAIFERAGTVLGQGEAIIARAEAAIARADGRSGLDTSAAQAALQAFTAALPGARSAYASAGAIAATHAGFDSSGGVVDLLQAASTAREFGNALRQVQSAMGGAGRTLRDCLRALRPTGQ